MGNDVRWRKTSWVLPWFVVVGCAQGNIRHVPVPTKNTTQRPPVTAQEVTTLEDLIGKAWPRRDDAAVLGEIIDNLELLTSRSTGGADAMAGQLSRLSHAYFLQARIKKSQNDRKAMQESLARGVIVGERALMALYPVMEDVLAQPDPITAHLSQIDERGMGALTSYVANLGAYAASRGMTSLIFYRDRVTAVLERMLMVDADYAFSTPHRFWAILLARAPAFAGGSLEQARIHFEHAMAQNPQYFANACDYAQFYAVPKGDRALFERLLQKVVQGDADALQDVAPEMRMEQARAHDLLSRVEALF